MQFFATGYIGKNLVPRLDAYGKMKVSSKIQEDFYPFGLSFNSFTRQSAVPQNYLYQEKEWQQDLGLNLFDFEWRQFDPAIGRTTTQDPHGDFYQDLSPYAFLNSNPINIIDPNGADALGVNEDRYLFNKKEQGSATSGDGSLSTCATCPGGSGRPDGGGEAYCPTCPPDKKYDPYRDDKNQTWVYDKDAGIVANTGGYDQSQGDGPTSSPYIYIADPVDYSAAYRTVGNFIQDLMRTPATYGMGSEGEVNGKSGPPRRRNTKAYWINLDEFQWLFFALSKSKLSKETVREQTTGPDKEGEALHDAFEDEPIQPGDTIFVNTNKTKFWINPKK